MCTIFRDKAGLNYRVKFDSSSTPNDPRWMIQTGMPNTEWQISTTFNFTPLDSFRTKEAAEKYLINNIERIL